MARRGQSTVEAIALALVVAALLAATATAGASAARAVAGALAGALPGHRVAHRDDRRALLAETLARRLAPTLVLERDRFGEDASVPVAFETCRTRACAALGRGRPTAYVHVHRRGAATYVHYWLYYPDSQTSHLPLAALRGQHDDDWEGVIVRVGDDGALAARATAHAGFAGAGPWWDERSGWRQLTGPPLVFRAAGSHANGFARDDVDLAADRWNGDLAVIPPEQLLLLPADEARSGGRRFDPAASPPWLKAAWRDEDVPGTSSDGGRGRAAEAAEAWARVAGAVDLRSRREQAGGLGR